MNKKPTRKNVKTQKTKPSSIDNTSIVIEETDLTILQTLAYDIVGKNGFVELYNRPMNIMDAQGDKLSTQSHALLYQDQLFRDATELAHIASEVFEAFEELRKKDCNREKLEEEIADIIIKTLTFSSRLEINVAKAVCKKLSVLQTRGILHDKRF